MFYLIAIYLGNSFDVVYQLIAIIATLTQNTLTINYLCIRFYGKKHDSKVQTEPKWYVSVLGHAASWTAREAQRSDLHKWIDELRRQDTKVVF